MADRKISELTALTAPAAGDYLPIVDISEAAAVSRNKRITIEELFRGIPLGTAAAPSIAIEGDENTGIYSPGADQLAISTGGTGRLFVDASGRLGLGTSSPSSVLDVQGTGTTVLGQVTNSTSFTGGNNFTTPHFRIRNSNDTTNEVTRFAFLVGNGGQVYLDSILENATTSYSSFAIRTRGADTLGERVRIDSSGRVGIGTTSPANGRLNVSGSTNQIALDTGDTATYGRLGIGHFSNGTFIGTYAGSNSASDLIRLGTGGTERMRLDSSGRLGVGTSSPSARFHVSGGDSVFGSTNLCRILSNGQVVDFTNAAQDTYVAGRINGLNLKFYTNTGSGIDIDSSGRVGIGTTSPGYTLDVNGSAKITTNSLNDSYFGFGANFDNYFTCGVSGSQIFRRYNTETARIDSSGRLLVGTSSSVENVGGNLQVNGGAATISTFIANSAAYRLYFVKSRSGTFNGKAIVQSGDDLGRISFNGDDGVDYSSEAASIACQVDGTPGADDMPGRLVFSTTADGASSPTERMRIDSSGRVGIGTTSPSAPLTFAGSTGRKIGFYQGTEGYSIGVESSEFRFVTDSGGAFTFRNGATYSSATEYARIDSSGRLLVGTSSTRTISGATGKLQIEGTNDAYVPIVANRTDVGGPGVFLVKTRGSTVGSNTVVQSDDQLGQIRFYGTDGTGPIEAASIFAYVDGTPGTNDMPGRIVLSTTADGASSPTERMRIGNDGNVFIGKTSSSVTTAGLRLAKNGTSEFIASGNDVTPLAIGSADDVTLTLVTFHGASATAGGSISISGGTSVAYNTSSDYRLKENVVSLTGAIDRVNQLQVHRFNFIANPDKTVDGFIAHEAQAVVPECVTGTKDEVDADGNPVYQGIDQSKLVPLLTAALQEALQKIEDLEGRLTAAGI